jgi:plasmid stabilization system protein ParE
MAFGGISRNKAATQRIGWRRKSSGVADRLAKYPLMGALRQDITSLPVRFWTVAKCPNYVIVYRPDAVPLQVVAVLHGKRDLTEVMKRRSV